jgi:S1-C subfamily serine protease
VSRLCPECKLTSPVQLQHGESCASCTARAVWSQLERGGKPLVIDRDDIAAAEARRTGRRERWWRRVGPWLFAALSGALATVSAIAVVRLFMPRNVTPLGMLVADLDRSAWRSLGAGIAALGAGAGALYAVRRGRSFRRIAIVAAHLAAVVAGAVATVGAGLSARWFGQPPGFERTTMPPRPKEPPSRLFDRIAAATAVVLAPGADGDARSAALGTASVIGVAAGRVYLVTCSHVAMPYAPPATWRDPAKARPVWVELADGRGAQSRVVWTARPPLDVALVETPLDIGPEPVAISGDSDEVASGQEVFFVPNPYRSGWIIHGGKVVKRELHRTPAGPFSLLFTDLPVQHGDSGSGLFDSFGRLVGLNTWTRNGADGPQGISLPSSTMRAIAAAVKNGRLEDIDGVLLEERGSP